MIREEIKFLLALLAVCSVSTSSGGISSTGVGVAWDISPVDRPDYNPVNQLTWSRFADSPFVVRSISGTGGPHPSRQRRHIDTVDDLQAVPLQEPEQLTGKRERRNPEDDSTSAKPEKISGGKNVREARMMSTADQTWSRQPPSIQFRHRPSLDQLVPDNYEYGGGGAAGDAGPDNEEAANLPPPIRAHYAPKTDFVTSGRSRSPPPDGRYPLNGPAAYHPEGRESRDMPIARSYDEYDVPIFRNVVREHDFDVPIPRNYYYPNRYRSQRDYYYRGGNGGAGPSYMYDRYRDEDEDYELHSRYRATPKPKRIIYYATLPEIVRKPVDLRNYRPYDPQQLRSPEAPIETEQRTRVQQRQSPNNVEPSRRPAPVRYPYDDNYDNYVKRSSYYDRRRPAYAAGEEDRMRDSERGRGRYKEKMRSDDRKLDNQIAHSGDDRRLPWPVQIGTEVSVKENERIPGRKIFGQIEEYERYEGSRVKKTSGNPERKEDMSDDNNNNNSGSNNNRNNN